MKTECEIRKELERLESKMFEYGEKCRASQWGKDESETKRLREAGLIYQHKVNILKWALR